MSTHKTRFNAGETIDGRYEVIQMLASGGMGELYKVRHVHLGDFRVVKVLKSRLLSDDTTKQRFLREAKLAASIKNPYLASLFDFSSLADGSYYMVMEYIAGVTLAERIRAGEHFELPFILRVGEQVLSGLSALHHAGIIHRDISPDNLMLTEINGTTSIKIIDLGIAKPAEGGEGLTSDGFFVGKLHYASPEQAGMLEPDQKLDQRTDLYSLGVVLYEMATERMPFSADSPQTYFLKQVSEEVQPINPVGGMPKIPYDAEQFILKLLKRDRSERFADADEALAALAKLTGGSTAPRVSTGDVPLQQPARPLELDLPPKGPSGPTPLGGGAVPLGGALPSRPGTPPQTQRPTTDPGALSEMIPETVIFDPKSLPDLGSAAADEDATVFSDSLEQSTPADQGPKRRDRITEELPLVVVPPSASPSQPAPYGGDEDMTVTSAPEPEPVYAPDRTVVQSFPEPEPAPSPLAASAGSSLADEILRRGQGSAPRPTTPLRTELPPPPPATIVESFADMGVNRPAMKVEQAPPEPEVFGRTVAEPYNPGVAAGYQQGAIPPPPPVLPQRPAKKSSAMPIIIGLVVLALLAAAAFAAWRFVSARNAAAVPATTVADSTQPVVPPPPAATPTPVPIQTPPPMNDFGTLTGTMPPNVLPSVTPMPSFTPLSEPTTTPTPRKKKEVKKPTPTPRPQATVAPTAVPVSTPVPPSVREGELVTPGPGVTDARITRWSPPSYPKAAERLRAAGTSEMSVLIDENGSPQDVKILKSSGFAPLDEEAQRVARKSTYRAATKQGVKVKMWIPVKVTFTRP